jgi:SAM-dependent methyltransferase
MTKSSTLTDNREARKRWNSAHESVDEGALSGQDPAEMLRHHGLVEHMHPGMTILDIGVGRGYAARYFREAHSAVVDCMDIADRAHEVVAPWCRRFILAGRDELYSEEYDLAVSHLTAQHMSDRQLRAQVKAVGHALKPGGIFSLHLAGSDRLGEEDLRGPIPEGMDGRMCRSKPYMLELVQEELGDGWTASFAGREIAWPAFESRWYFMHVRRQP